MSIVVVNSQENQTTTVNVCANSSIKCQLINSKFNSFTNLCINY